MNTRLYLDCTTSLGKHGTTDARVPHNLRDLLANMEHAGIHGALVWHWLAQEYDPMFGNQVLMQEIAGNPRLFPCWILLPHHVGEMPRGSEVVRMMQAQGVKAARMLPRKMQYLFNEGMCGEILSALQEAQIPLLLDVGIYGDDQQVTFEEVDWLCGAYPHLPVILQKARWETTRTIVYLLEKHPNTYIEFSNFQVNYAPELLASKIGANRLLLGTEYPFKSQGAARSFVDYCELSENDKAQFAGLNLAKLLKLEEANLPTPYPEKDQGLTLNRAKQGLPIEHIPIIDTHTHILHDGLHGAGGYVPMPFGDAEHLIRRNRRMGVDKICCSSWIGIWIDATRGNEFMRDLCERFPDDFIAYATIDPKKSDNYEAEIALCHDEYGFRGLKPYNPRVGLPYNSPSYDKWYEKGNEIGGFVKLHQTAIGDNFLNEIADIAVRFPNMNYLLAHSAWTWRLARERAEFAKKFPNVYLDLTFTSVLHGVIEYFVEEGLEDRVLFTTDAPMRDPIPQFGWVVYAQITEAQKEKILGGNALNILNHAGL